MGKRILIVFLLSLIVSLAVGEAWEIVDMRSVISDLAQFNTDCLGEVDKIAGDLRQQEAINLALLEGQWTSPWPACYAYGGGFLEKAIFYWGPPQEIYLWGEGETSMFSHSVYAEWHWEK